MISEMNERNKQELLNKGKIFYKFSKSKEEYKDLTSEWFHKDYPENSIIKAEASHGLSFCDDIEKLLLCCGYGDQITQVIIDPSSPYFNDVYEYLEKEMDEYGSLGEYTTFVMQTGKNYSLSDPTVVNALIQNANSDALANFIYYRNNKGKTIEEIYKEYGFEKTSQFVKEFKQEVYKKYKSVLHNDNRLDDFKKIANSLIEKYKDKTKENFSFTKAENDYEKIKENVKDRRSEKIDFIKNGDYEIDIFHDMAIYFYVNHFTKGQAAQISNILTENKILDADKLNTILPKFSPKFSDKLLDKIRHEIRNNNFSFEEICNFLDKNVENCLNKKESIHEIIFNKFKDYEAEKNNNYRFSTIPQIEARYR